MTNSVDPNQTARSSLIWVDTLSTSILEFFNNVADDFSRHFQMQFRVNKCVNENTRINIETTFVHFMTYYAVYDLRVHIYNTCVFKYKLDYNKKVLI